MITWHQHSLILLSTLQIPRFASQGTKSRFEKGGKKRSEYIFDGTKNEGLIYFITYHVNWAATKFYLQLASRRVLIYQIQFLYNYFQRNIQVFRKVILFILHNQGKMGRKLEKGNSRDLRGQVHFFCFSF